MEAAHIVWKLVSMRKALITFTPAEVAAYYGARIPNLRQPDTNEWRGPCPVHRGTRDSFAVQRATGCWFCHSACDRGGDIISLERALVGADFRTARDEVFRIIGRAPSLNGNSNGGTWRKVAVYEYHDEANAPLFRVIRRERSDGPAREKKFHIERFEGGLWIKGLGTVRPVLYRLPEIRQAGQVFVCEGEKDADTLVDWALPGTTCPMGAGRWLPEYSPHFEGKHAIILADNDDPGRTHALHIAEQLLPLAVSVRVLELPDLPPKGDVTDWKCAGGTRDQLLDLIERTNPLTPAGLDEFRKRWVSNAGQTAVSEKHNRAPRSAPFQVTDEGVFFLKGSDDGTTDCVRLAARVDVVAKTRDAGGESWGRLLRWRDEEGRMHQWTMPMEMLASDAGAVRARLLSEGLPYISTNARLRERFAEYLQTTPVQKYARCVSRVGWHEGIYVLPDRAIGPPSNEEILYQTPYEAAHNWNTKGDAGQWREEVGRRCSGNSRLIFAASCGFAGPLPSLVGAESGGVHFFGGTSQGKTTALIVGGSVCGGGGQQGFLETWRTTINGLEAMAEAHNDGTLFLDELAQADPRDVAEAAYLLGNGQGKGRMTRGFGARPRLRWTLLYVSSGETTLAEHAATAGKTTKGGAEVRLLNIPADAGGEFGLFEELHGVTSPDAFALELKAAALRFYGSPLRVFLERLTRERTEVERVFSGVRDAFIDRFVPRGASGEVTRAAGRFAMISTAGELATEWGITGWRQGEAIEAAERCFREWLKRRGTIGASDLEAAIRQVRAFFESNGASRFQTLNPASLETEAEGILNRAGFKRRTKDRETEYLVLLEVFRNEVCAGYNYQAVLKELDKRRFLVRDGSNMAIKPRLPELGSVRVYCIRAAILDADEC
jgi:putative DNA primase/helicase